MDGKRSFTVSKKGKEKERKANANIKQRDCNSLTRLTPVAKQRSHGFVFSEDLTSNNTCTCKVC